MNLDLSIVIACYNCEKTITRCLDSIPRESGIEIILVDDNSTDSTASIILDYIKNIQIPINFLKYMKIRQYLVSTKNNTLLDYLQYSFQQLLKDDLYEELK